MKKALITAVLLILIGSILCISVIFFIGFDFHKLQTVEMTESTQFIDGSFEDIAIKTTAADIVLRRSENGECKLVSRARKGTVFSVGIIGETLTVEELSAPGEKWYDRIEIYTEESKSVLYLPDTAFEIIKAETVSGDVVLPKEFYFGYTDVLSVSGDLFIYSASDGQTRLKTTSGDITVNERKCSDISAVTTSGDIGLRGVTASGDLMLKSTSGDIELKGCDGASITINTVSGDVEGRLLTPKSFSVNTTSGDVEIPRRSAGDPCVITTVSGDIEIDVLG